MTTPLTTKSEKKREKALKSGDFRTSFVAERERFELSVRDYRTHDFQSCALDQLSHLSVPTLVLYYFFSRLSRTFANFLKYFFKILVFCTSRAPVFLRNLALLVDFVGARR